MNRVEVVLDSLRTKLSKVKTVNILTIGGNFDFNFVFTTNDKELENEYKEFNISVECYHGDKIRMSCWRLGERPRSYKVKVDGTTNYKSIAKTLVEWHTLIGEKALQNQNRKDASALKQIVSEIENKVDTETINNLLELSGDKWEKESNIYLDRYNLQIEDGNSLNMSISRTSGSSLPEFTYTINLNGLLNVSQTLRLLTFLNNEVSKETKNANCKGK